MQGNHITIFTDGSSRGNPGPGGWGAIISGKFIKEKVYKVDVIELGGGEGYTTNNRMELTAAIQALEFVHKLTRLASASLRESRREAISPDVSVGIPTDSRRGYKLTLHTDSRYVINGITKWVKGWKAKGWITTQKQDVLNRDLWERLSDSVDIVSRDNEIIWKYVGGHVGIPANERCDEIATMYADKRKPDLYSGSVETYPIDLSVTIADIPAQQEKDGARSRSKAKAHSYISAVGGVVKTHLTWADCEKRVKGAKGAKYKKALSAEEERRIVSEFSL